MQMKISATINRLVDKQDSSVKAYASVTIDGMFAVHGLRVMETEKGRFVNMPSTSYTDRDGNKQYSDILDRKSTRLNSSHYQQSRMPSSA